MHAHAHIRMHAPRHPHKQTHSCTCMNTHTFTHACSHAMFWHKWYWWLLRKLHDQQHLVICAPLCVPSLLVCLSGTKIGTSALVKSSIWLLHEGKDKGTVLVPLRCFPGVTPIHSLKKKIMADNLLTWLQSGNVLLYSSRVSCLRRGFPGKRTLNEWLIDIPREE